MNIQTSIVQQLFRELRWSRLMPSLTVGLITGILEVILAISFSALIFSGSLSPFLSNGIGIALMGAILSGAAIALLTSTPGVLSGNQDVPSAIIAVAAAAVAVSMSSAPDYARYVTVVVMIGMTTVLTGAFFYGLARLQMGRLMRFLPYPVVGGFLAATGWLLLAGGIGIMTDLAPTLSTAGALFEPAVLLRWLPGLILAAAIVFVLQRVENVLALPAIVFGSIALFYTAAAIGGETPRGLLSGGWLLGPFPQQRLWQPLGLTDLTLVEWEAIGSQIPQIATAVLMSTIALLLNSSGLELAIGREISPNRELRAAGIGNLLAGAIGGLVGFQQLSLSVMSHKVAGASRLAGLLAAGICAIVLVLGASMLSFFPKIVLGGLVCYLGLSFLVDTIFVARDSLPSADYGVMVLILIISATIGFMEAVAVGLLAAVGLFIVNYSGTDVVRDEQTGRTLQSRVTRSPELCRRLDEAGERIVIMRLQGFIFFGTADTLYSRIRGRLEGQRAVPLNYLILDFRDVTGIDSTARMSFVRMIELARRQSLTLVFTSSSAGLEKQVAARDVRSEEIHFFDQLDQGLEWCEEQLLASATPGKRVTDRRQDELARRLGGPGTMQRLLAHFERMEVEEGDVLMRQGEPSDMIFLMESGQITAYREKEDGSRERLQTMRDWNVVGEVGFFLETRRTATVIAERRGVLYRASRPMLAKMRDSDPDIAVVLHRLIIELLAERVTHLVTVVDALRR